MPNVRSIEGQSNPPLKQHPLHHEDAQETDSRMQADEECDSPKFYT